MYIWRIVLPVFATLSSMLAADVKVNPHRANFYKQGMTAVSYVDSLPGGPVATSTTGSDIGCVTACYKNPTCKSAVFDTEAGLCYLYSSRLQQNVTNSSTRYVFMTFQAQDNAGLQCRVEGSNIRGLKYPTSEHNMCRRPTDCRMIHDHHLEFQQALQDGVYTVYPDDGEGIDVYCDMTTDGGGWTVFQRRVDASVDFYRGWTDYITGFGVLEGNLWLGLENIHRLSSAAPSGSELYIYMDDFDDVSAYARYGQFSLLDAATDYTLSVGQYSGTAGDGMTAWHSGMKFSTHDNDHDLDAGVNCAEQYKGAWWYNNCHIANLNGQYLGGVHASFADGINWVYFRENYYSLRTVSMKMRRL